MKELSEDVMKASRRYEVLLKLMKGLLNTKEVAVFLDLHPRQVRRLRRRVESEGLKGLLYRREHGSWNQVDEKEKSRILELRGMYRTYNLLHFRDVLKEKYGIERSREYYRKLCLKEKLYQSSFKKKRRIKHRIRFEAPQAGILIQRDTSIHFWIPGADKALKLILDLDDHSRKITGAYFSEFDDVLSNMLVAWETLSEYGLPVAYYTDNNPIFNPLNKKPKGGMYQFYRWREGEEKESITQFKRALRELAINCIHAAPYQPQGKGKIERIFRFMQDRLVQEMMTARVTDIHQANKYLRKWVRWYNHHHVHSSTKMIPEKRFHKSNAFRKLPKEIDLKEIFCLKHSREVKADHTFQLEGQTYQIHADEYRISYAKAKIELRTYLNRKLKAYYQGRQLKCTPYNPNQTKRTFYRGNKEDILALR